MPVSVALSRCCSTYLENGGVFVDLGRGFVVMKCIGKDEIKVIEDV